VSAIVTVTAPNPSALTLDGTNAYLLDGGNGEAICIDPGPDFSSHVDALIDAAHARGCRIATILVTHGHPDHWPASVPLAKQSGARVFAHVDSAVPHDATLDDGERLRCGELDIVALDAPGHTFDHLVFYEPRERALFTGDVVLGKGTVVIAPPGGAMRPYQRTLERLASHFPEARTIYGGHGPRVDDAPAKIRAYIAHRQLRERELMAALGTGEQTVPQLVQRIYAEIDPLLWPAAARQLYAYLDALQAEFRVIARPLDRALTPQESAILNPAWSKILGAANAALAQAELGTHQEITTLETYALA